MQNQMRQQEYWRQVREEAEWRLWKEERDFEADVKAEMDKMRAEKRIEAVCNAGRPSVTVGASEFIFPAGPGGRG